MTDSRQILPARLENNRFFITHNEQEHNHIQFQNEDGRPVG